MKKEQREFEEKIVELITTKLDEAAKLTYLLYHAKGCRQMLRALAGIAYERIFTIINLLKEKDTNNDGSSQSNR